MFSEVNDCADLHTAGLFFLLVWKLICFLVLSTLCLKGKKALLTSAVFLLPSHCTSAYIRENSYLCSLAYVVLLSSKENKIHGNKSFNVNTFKITQGVHH